ncbi:hypothetical protein Glove_750g34 [Diversispora epigaea]|uniref:Uncharacterized protein n=1 Tax=Diversispora epigaea TaxID=1348612 RepID=A0A397G2E0_9GLOM|nr:hypothetical protein Glove_750g34 [Diversispora epigaea]
MTMTGTTENRNSKNSKKSQNHNEEILLLVNWGREKIQLDFNKEGPGSLGTTTLKQMKERLKNVTGVPLNGQKLLFSGAVLKDETAMLTSFGLCSSSKLILMGSKPNEKDLAQTSTGSPEEYALIQRISKSIESTTTSVLPQIETFETSVTSYLSSTTNTDLNNDSHNDSNNEDRSKLLDLHHMLVENLMQSLLALDGVVCPPEFNGARQKRREAVKFTQELIDRVDGIKEKLVMSKQRKQKQEKENEQEQMKEEQQGGEGQQTFSSSL